MKKPNRPLDEYQLFYEEVGRNRSDERSGSSRKENSYDRPGGLNEDQLAKLSDDLRTPIKDSSNDSNLL